MLGHLPLAQVLRADCPARAPADPYNPVMSADAPVFTLRYDTELDDLAELAHLDDRRKRLRMRAAIGLPCILLITGLLTGLTVALNRPSVSAQGAPGWLYVVDTLGWLYVLWHLRMLWRLSPAVIARRVWRTRPGIRGAHQEEISDAGIVATAPGQPRVFFPWSSLAGIEETSRAFHIGGERARQVTLPKRGLPDAGQIPALREFLHQAIAGQRPASADPAATTD